MKHLEAILVGFLDEYPVEDPREIPTGTLRSIFSETLRDLDNAGSILSEAPSCTRK